MGVSVVAFAALATLYASGAAADDTLEPGAYEVRYRLELPHVGSRAEATAIVCLSDVDAAFAFPVLSANNPLARCPATNVRREESAVLFDIVCPGGNAAKAQGLFDLRRGAFDGRIAMNMGGKNMTMTEVQRGRRVGECSAAHGR